MTQTKLESFIESITNVAIGYIVAVSSQAVLFPLFDIHVNWTTHLELGAYFTVVSIIRSYLVRRYFNNRK